MEASFCGLRIRVVWVAMLAPLLVFLSTGLVRAQLRNARAVAIQAEQGNVNLSRSRVYVFVGKKGFGHEHGVVGKLVSGRLALGAASAAGELVFDITSFSADTKDARRYVGLAGETDASTCQQVTENMLGAAVLNAKRHPTATFAISSATRLADQKRGDPPRYKLDGEFTLRGATKPLSVVAQISEEEGEYRLRGSFRILQSEYGIRPFSKAFGAVGVADELRIWGDVWLRL